MQVYSRYAIDNYIMVFQDVRGKYMSEGTYEDIRPVIPEKKSNNDIDETTDTWDTVDWLVKNVEGNNGNVGLYGISYPGFYSTMGLIGAHPALKAVSPQAPVTAWFIGDDFHHNGAFFLLDCFGFYYSNGRAFRKPSRRGFPSSAIRHPTIMISSSRWALLKTFPGNIWATALNSGMMPLLIPTMTVSGRQGIRASI